VVELVHPGLNPRLDIDDRIFCIILGFNDVVLSMVGDNAR
jgi:hypothetical protein